MGYRIKTELKNISAVKTVEKPEMVDCLYHTVHLSGAATTLLVEARNLAGEWEELAAAQSDSRDTYTGLGYDAIRITPAALCNVTVVGG